MSLRQHPRASVFRDSTTERRRHLDAVTVLTIYLALLYCLPQRYVVSAVGAAGTPAVLFSLPLLFLWLITRCSRELCMPGRQPVRYVVGIYYLLYLLSYAYGYARGLAATEADGTDRYLIYTTAMCGVALVTVDGLDTRAKLDALARRLTYFAAVMSSVGLLQFLFSFDLTQRLKPPGLTLLINNVETAISDRNGFNRVAGTAGHAIELGVVSAMLIPLAVHFALYSKPGKDRKRAVMVLALIAAGVPISISRSGFVALVVAIVGLMIPWVQRLVRRATVVVLAGLAAMWLGVPGFLGSVTSLFTGLTQDDSYKARVARLPIVFSLIHQHFWLGLGPGTFEMLLDNQFLQTWMYNGFLGLLALISIFITGFVLGRLVLRRGCDEETKHLGNALGVGLLVAGVSAYFADMLFYEIYTGTVFMILGLVGALWRMAHVESPRGEAVNGPILRRYWRLAGSKTSV